MSAHGEPSGWAGAVALDVEACSCSTVEIAVGGTWRGCDGAFRGSAADRCGHSGGLRVGGEPKMACAAGPELQVGILDGTKDHAASGVRCDIVGRDKTCGSPASPCTGPFNIRLGGGVDCTVCPVVQ